MRECARQEKKDAEKRSRAALRRRLAEGRARRLAREGRLEEGLEDVLHALVRSKVDDALQSLLRLNGVVCSVCTQDFVDGEEYVTLPCTHLFHMHCILRWVSVSGNCPLCRFDLKSLKKPSTPTSAAEPASLLSLPATPTDSARHGGDAGDLGESEAQEEGEGAAGGRPPRQPGENGARSREVVAAAGRGGGWRGAGQGPQREIEKRVYTGPRAEKDLGEYRNLAFDSGSFWVSLSSRPRAGGLGLLVVSLGVLSFRA